jgi:hypothetical protein
MEEVYEFILDKCINHNNNNKFNHYYDIDNFLADIINNDVPDRVIKQEINNERRRKKDKQKNSPRDK